jgi:hypothetical protein
MIKRDRVTKLFASGLFHESSSHKPLKITLGSFIFFFSSKICGDIRKSICTTGINNTGDQLVTGVNNIGGKFATCTADVADTRGNNIMTAYT